MTTACRWPGYIGPFLRGELAVDPPALATAFAGPVLVVNGLVDVQVSAALDAAALDAALARRAHDDRRLIRVPVCGHHLKPVKSDTDAGVAGDVPPATLDAIGDWAAQHL